MTLLSNLKKSYKVAVKCKNCGDLSDISVPKGITIDSFLASEKSLCPACGNNTLEKYFYPRMDDKKANPSQQHNQPQPRISQPQPRITPIFDLPKRKGK